MGHKQPNPDKSVRDRDRLAEHLINDLGPWIVPSLRGKLRRTPTEEPEGVLDEAAVSLLASEGLDDLKLEDIESRYWDVCRIVATQYARDAAERRRRGERSVPVGSLEQLAADRSSEPVPAAPQARSRRHQRVWRTLRSLSERHRKVLRKLMRLDNAKVAAAMLAERLGISKEAARMRLARAMNRFKKAFLRQTDDQDDRSDDPPWTDSRE